MVESRGDINDRVEIERRYYLVSMPADGVRWVADTPAEVLALARAAHPDDEGRFSRIIPRERVARI